MIISFALAFDGWTSHERVRVSKVWTALAYLTVAYMLIVEYGRIRAGHWPLVGDVWVIVVLLCLVHDRKG